MKDAATRSAAAVNPGTSPMRTVWRRVGAVVTGLSAILRTNRLSAISRIGADSRMRWERGRHTAPSVPCRELARKGGLVAHDRLWRHRAARRYVETHADS